MIAILILVISVTTLLQFFVSYCHSLIADSRGHTLSEQAREIAGITGNSVHGNEFKRLLQLIAVCPETGTDRNQIRIVSAYFGLLGLFRMTVGRIQPAVARWIESELGGCAYVAAVMLDCRIAHSRVLMAQQMSN